MFIPFFSIHFLLVLLFVVFIFPQGSKSKKILNPLGTMDSLTSTINTTFNTTSKKEYNTLHNIGKSEDGDDYMTGSSEFDKNKGRERDKDKDRDKDRDKDKNIDSRDMLSNMNDSDSEFSDYDDESRYLRKKTSILSNVNKEVTI